MAVSWLHISDFHIKTGDPYDRKVVLDALVESVKGRPPIDLIFATGDIAHSGQASEYKIATQFFDNLLAAAHLSKDRLYVIPGNHDIDREVGENFIRTLASEERAITYFQPGKPKPHLTLKLGAFIAWHDEYFSGIRQWPQDSTCGPLAPLEINKQPLAILPINSALFCQGDDDHNKLWIGRRCLDGAIELLAKHANALKIALIHHPFDWLHELERTNIKAAILDSFDVVLRGHLHETEIEQSVFAAGAAYQSRRWPNRALFATFENGRLTILPTRYEDSPRPVWTLDPSLYPEPPYQKTFPLPRFPQTSAPPAAAPAPSRPIPSNIPPRFGPFVGRDGDLKRIAERLGPAVRESALVLHGHSGVGKSGLALEYARRNRSRYPGGTFFLNASPALLPTDLARLGQTYFDLHFPPDLPIPLQAQQTLSTLGSEPLLLIYDNAESVGSIRDLLPAAGSACHLLVTTVADPWEFDLPTLEVEPLSKPTSIDLIQALAGDEVAQAYGEQLAETASGLPMQICPAARMLRHERDKGQLSSAQITLTAEADQSFRGVYNRLDADSQLLLHAALQFNPQRILRDELSAHLKEGAAWDDAQCKKSLDASFDLHLLDGTAELRMHQLFATFLQQSTVPPELDERLHAIRSIQAQRLVQYAHKVGAKPTDAEAVSKLLAFPVDLSPWQGVAPAADDAHSIGYALFEIRRFDEARLWFERAVELKREPDPEGRTDHNSLGASLAMIGSCLRNAGHFAQANHWFEQAVAEKTQGDATGRINHESLGKSLHQVGYCLVEMGRYQEARLWFERAIPEIEKGGLAGRVNHGSLGASLHEIGRCLGLTQQYEEAKAWFERAIVESEKGDLHGLIDHEDLGRSLDWLAICYAETGNLPEALSLCERAIEQSRLGDVHGRVDKSSLADSLRNTASLLRKLDRIPEAEAYEAEANQLDPPES
ncbi:MAG TPA: metallophosphoesterase [Bryobacteraceae bacterium]|nr:metallophosphoesterase [Bryobacteraceae bacterium]